MKRILTGDHPAAPPELGHSVEGRVIKVVGIGGAGLNVVNAMLLGGIAGVEFVGVSTSQLHLNNCQAGAKIKIGSDSCTSGTGGNAEFGRAAAEESKQEILKILKGANLVFLAAGMGGSTGTGATPEIARIARESGAFVVAVVTRPFSREGKQRMALADKGILALRPLVDSLIIVPNDRLISVSGKGTSLLDTFKPADDLLCQAVQAVSDLLTTRGFINVDFADVKKILGKGEMVVVGTGVSNGKKRAVEAATSAISSPLFKDIDLSGAKGVLVNMTGSSAMTIDDYDAVNDCIREKIHENTNIIVGVVIDEGLGDKVKVTVIVTGLQP